MFISRFIKFFMFLFFILNFLQASQLDFIIKPEIKYDIFYNYIRKIASDPKIETVLEIGSSSGEGSTEAFILGLKTNPSRPKLFCMEISKPRFHQLKNHYQHLDFVKCYNLSSIGIEEFPSWDVVESFLNETISPLTKVGKKEVYRWYQQDIDYMKEHDAIENGILKIKAENDIKFFDMVLIDGSEFTGLVELPYVYGAGYILLDDINTFKNYQNFEFLKKDDSYDLIAFDKKIRNGFAIFKKKDL